MAVNGKGSGVPTRQRLLEAAIDIVRQEGPGALTTVRITRQAGIAQPGFYKYFPSVEVCLREAAIQASDRMRDMVASLRRSTRDRNDPQQLAEHYQAVFDLALRERVFVELGLRCRLDASPLGEAVREVNLRLRRDLFDDLWKHASQAGLSEIHQPRIRRLADMLLGNVEGCVLRVLTEPDLDRAALAHELAHFSIAGTMQAFAHLFGREVGQRRA
jgi:AcrR family transcriptional regulator